MNILALARKNSSFIYIFAISLFLRLMITLNGGFSLFQSGQDSPAYLAAAQDFVLLGWFSDEIRTLPFWPAGYPFFISLVLRIESPHWWIVLVIFQNMFFIIGALTLTYSLTNFFEMRYRKLLFALLLLLPTFIYSPSENMYESVVASSLMIATGLLIFSVQLKTPKLKYVALILSAFFLGFANFLQVKTLPITLIFLFVYAVRISKTVLMFLPIACWGFVVSIHRNFVAYKILSPSTNFGTVISDAGTKIPCNVSLSDLTNDIAIQSQTDRQLTSCAINFFFEHPNQLLAHITRQLVGLYGPMDGTGGTKSTWFHGLAMSRILNKLGFTGIDFFIVLGTVILNVLIISGVYISFRNKSRILTWQFLSPIVVLTFIHALSMGDSRYRIPFIPFQIIFLVTCLEQMGKIRVRSRLDRGRKISLSP